MLNVRAAALAAAVVLCAVPPLAAETKTRSRSAPRIQSTTIAQRNAQPLPQVDIGAADPADQVTNAILNVPLTSDARRRLDMLLLDLQDSTSPRYRQWLTPEQFADQFAPSAKDFQSIVDALRKQGLTTTYVAPSRTSIRFSGSVARFERAFGRALHRFKSDEGIELHFADETSSSAPLQEMAANVILRGDIKVKPVATRVVPHYTESSGHYIAPADFVTIYNVGPVYTAGYRGGTSSTSFIRIATVGRSAIDVADIRAFRSTFGLAANDPEIVNVGEAPDHTEDEIEADLDIEWAGAIAPLARIRYYASKDIGLTFQQAVNDNVSSVLSVSFYGCERSMGAAASAFIDGIWAQAAAQGISVFVASGDSGAAGCDLPAGNFQSGTGLGINALCTPNATCVGGTQFNEGSNASAYWNSTNDPNGGSAKSYIPERAWNQSTAGTGIWASGGGISIAFTRPSWQSAPGMPSGSMATQPDISAAAVNYLIYAGQVKPVHGTSASAPSLAAVFTLLRQFVGARLGNVNPTLYRLGRDQYGGTGPAVFHDITVGSNTVPGVTGFNSGTGYDMATGLGTINATALFNAWPSSSSPTTPTSCVPTTNTMCLQGNRFSVTISGTFNGQTAPGQAVTINNQFGYFSIPGLTNDPTNAEVLVKIAGPVNNHYWIFYGAITGFDVSITVTDMVTGKTRTYQKPVNTYNGGADFDTF